MTPIALLGVGLLSLGTVASAQPAETAPRGEARPSLDRAGLQSRLETMFDSADADGDGVLSVEERKARRDEARAKMQERRFSRLDADKDGAISKEEFSARRDRDRTPRADGARERPRDDKAQHGGKRGHHGAFGGGMMMSGKFGEYRNKPIPRATFIEAGLATFDRIDTDRDGKISSTERDATRKAMMERRKAARQQPTQ